MAEDTLAERDPTFNQSSLSSRSKAAFQLSERVTKMEFVAMLLAKADALASVALRDAFSEASPSSERHHYLAALQELIAAACEQVDNILASSRRVEE